MYLRRLLLVTFAVAGLLACQSTADNKQPLKRTADELSATRIDKLFTLFKPDPKQSFESVPWLTSLWAARQQAAAEDKPIVLWAGDPLPLGIT